MGQLDFCPHIVQGEGDGEGEGGEARARVARQLAEGPRSLVELYNDCAAPLRLWGMAIELLDVARHQDDAMLRQLWDLHLLQVHSACACACAYLLLGSSNDCVAGGFPHLIVRHLATGPS